MNSDVSKVTESSPFFQNLADEARKEGIQKFVAGGVIASNNAVLILRRKPDDFLPNIYELPSGGVKKHETIQQGLCREVYEETGLVVSNILDYLGHFDYQSAGGNRTRQFNFLLSVIPHLEVKMTEHDHYVWCEQMDLGKYDITEKVMKIIANYFEVIKR
ncbi:MAG: putative nudix hydrolase [Parachlamydiales bacterium]|nr:putative nudix hydrolase [Parachlamydiales bacterium]